MRGYVLWAVAVVMWLAWVGFGWWGEKRLQVHVFDVGQGDAILIVTPEKGTVLIDGGAGDYVLRRLGEVLPPWIRTIDVVVLTHPHADHINGLLEVIDRYNVEEIWMHEVEYGYVGYEVFLQMVSESDVRVRDSSLEKISENIGGVQISKINEEERQGGAYESNSNNNMRDSGDFNVNNESVVVLVEYGTFKMLLTGDAERELESEILNSRYRTGIRDIDVLKAGHHCSKTASSEEFLSVTRPDAAICSCGEGNSFGHPHQETLDRFDEFGVSVYRTDISGTVSVYSDGVDWWVE